MYCIEENTFDVVGTFRRPQRSFDARKIVFPCPPRYAPASNQKFLFSQQTSHN